MDLNLSFEQLMEYTDWERDKWRAWFREHGDKVLQISVGPNGDGRFQSIGDLVKHVFGAEKRYIEWLSGRPPEQLTNLNTIPSDNAEALFQFGEQSRSGLRHFVKAFPPPDWEDAKELRFLPSPVVITATPKKIVTHVLIHEIRHWAQIATMLRLNGMTAEMHDFLASPVMGGEWKSETPKA